MKYLIKILMALAGVVFASSIASAGDKPKSANEISPRPSSLSESTITSTQNDTTTPVELSNPAKAIDNAISSPPKDPSAGNSVDIGQPSTDPSASNAMNKAATEYNKPVHKSKKHSSKRSKKSQKYSKSKKTKTTKSSTSITKKK